MRLCIIQQKENRSGLNFITPSNNKINLNNWSISDVVTTPFTAKIAGDYFVPPGSFIIISRDSSILNYHRIIPSGIIVTNLPVLNNDSDGIALKDDRNFTIDSVFYNVDWSGKSG